MGKRIKYFSHVDSFEKAKMHFQHHGNSISLASYDTINNKPICLILNNFHFTALLKRITTYNFPVINCNNNQFLRFISKCSRCRRYVEIIFYYLYN